MSKPVTGYLGDGLYAAFDGYQIELSTVGGKNRIYLEWKVYCNFVDFVREIGWSKKEARQSEK